MDRPIIYPGQIPQDTDLLNTNKNAMVALGFLMQAVLGTSLAVDGLACTPNSPAALNVLVGPGSIHSLQNVDGTPYGTIPADTTNQIVKQGLSLGTQTFGCPAPVTTGHSIVYLIQAAYQDVDAGATVLPYYNASNPSVAWSGPNNSGVSQNTVRRGACLVGVKAGTSATTGTQTTPAPDPGYVGLYAVTVANGQTTITSGHIQRLASAPFIDAKLPAMLSMIQSGEPGFAQDTSGAANTIAISLSPVPSALTNGMAVRAKIANTVTGPTVMNVNGTGNVAVVTTSGVALGANALLANGIYTFVYDANGNRWQVQGSTATVAEVPTGTVLEYSGITPPGGFLWAAGQAISRTTYASLFGAITATATGTTANGNPAISSVSADLTGLGLVGAKVEGAGIPAGATIVGLSSTTITLSANATASASGVTLRILPHGNGDGSTTFNVPDRKGRVGVGRDDMGGTAANRITNAVSGIVGTTLGAAGGDQRMQQHTHTANVTDPGHVHTESYVNTAAFGSPSFGIGAPTNYQNTSGNTSSATTGITVSIADAGTGSSQNVQPTIIQNYIIKT